MVTTDKLQIFVRARLVQIFDALEKCGLTPIPQRDLHAFSFFVNVLSPVWDLQPLEGSVLKQKDGPFSSILQTEVENLVVLGVLRVDRFALEKIGKKRELVASFSLNRKFSRELLQEIEDVPDERATSDFLLELAAAFGEIKPDRRDDAALVDAAYSDPSIVDGRIVDFADWVESKSDNASWNTIQMFQDFAPEGIKLNRAEKLAMYMRLMKRKAHG